MLFSIANLNDYEVLTNFVGVQSRFKFEDKSRQWYLVGYQCEFRPSFELASLECKVLINLYLFWVFFWG